jgi:hypothetical protein
MSKVREPHIISIPCICGERYDTQCGFKDEAQPYTGVWNPNAPYRFHTCPKCGHVWDISPPPPRISS